MTASPWVSVAQGRAEFALPLLCDSPHSGTRYPEDFDHNLPLTDLRSSEDTHVERLWGHAPQVGAALLAAHFPRTYIDANRTLADLDADMLGEPWQAPLPPSRKTELGIGLIWRQVRADAPIYARKLSAWEVQQRIDHCWQPYHAALQTLAAHTLARWGHYWHLNLHSMPHNAYQRLGIDSPTPLADFVLGDLHGKSCSAEFTRFVKSALEAHGFRVAVNDPYEGQELVRLMGEPCAGRHSLQIEINRSLYMDERTREPSAHFDDVRLSLSSVLEEIARYVRRSTVA
ncbi:MAG: N-formylglutamate amidohydrolase [Cytophagales bacterium]|nr:N-formylglutamate amidohydrolase [Rhizobacter sp.]